MSFGFPKGAFWVFVILILQGQVVFSARLREPCFVYSYETLLGIFSKDFVLLPLEAKEKAFNMAGDSCRMESNDKCLKYAYKRFQELNLAISPQDQLDAWGEAVNACRKKVDEKCLSYAENFWTNTPKERDPYRAFQNAITSCNDEVYGDCLEFVYLQEYARGRSEVAAFNSGVSVCRGGTSKACLETLYKKIIPEARPFAENPWEDVISVCIRR